MWLWRNAANQRGEESEVPWTVRPAGSERVANCGRKEVEGKCQTRAHADATDTARPRLIISGCNELKSWVCGVMRRACLFVCTSMKEHLCAMRLYFACVCFCVGVVIRELRGAAGCEETEGDSSCNFSHELFRVICVCVCVCLCASLLARVVCVWLCAL